MLEITFAVIAVDMQRTIFPWIWQKVRFVFQEAGLHQLASDIYFSFSCPVRGVCIKHFFVTRRTIIYFSRCRQESSGAI